MQRKNQILNKYFAQLNLFANQPSLIKFAYQLISTNSTRFFWCLFLLYFQYIISYLDKISHLLHVYCMHVVSYEQSFPTFFSRYLTVVKLLFSAVTFIAQLVERVWFQYSSLTH